MASVSTYLNFPRNTEEAFLFYKSVFQTEFMGEIMRMGGMPPQDGTPAIDELDKDLIMHIALPITGAHYLFGTDAPESFGFNVIMGNNMHICINPDTKEEADRLYNALLEGGFSTMEMQDTFWGAYYGSCTDKFGVQWMFNYHKR